MHNAIIVHVKASEPQWLDNIEGLAGRFPDFSIIAVSDLASATEAAAWEALRRRHSNVAFYALGAPLGKGAALRAALNKCSAEYVALLDADGRVSESSIHGFFSYLRMRPEIDGIVGNRWKNGRGAECAFGRRLVSSAFAMGARAMFRIPQRDPQAPLKVFRREALQRTFEALRLHDRGFDVELLYQCRRHGLRLAELPLQWKAGSRSWRVGPTALSVFAALAYVRLLNSPLKHLPGMSFLGRPHDVPVKRSYSIMIFCWRDPSNPQAGGGEVYLHEQAMRWAQAGHRVTWFAQAYKGCAHDETRDGIRFVRRGGFPFVFLLAPLWYLCKSDRSYDFIIDCMNGIPFFTPLFSTKPKVCLLYHVHSHHFKSELPPVLGAAAAAVETRLTPLVYRNTRFVTISESSKAEIEQHGIARLPVELIYSGVAPELVPCAKALRPTILYLGRLKKYKRVRKLIDAFADIKTQVLNAELVIAGTGDDEQDLKDYVIQRGVADVRFEGRVDDAGKARLMQEAWVFGMPSSIEGWGIVVIEANACATPAVAYDVPGLRDCIRHGTTGYLAANDDEFKNRLLEILTDPHLACDLSQDAYEWSKRFSWAATAERTLERIRRAQPWRAVFEPGAGGTFELRVQRTGLGADEAATFSYR